jgi:hypothetical protein
MSRHLDALKRANVTRLGIARVKGEVASLGQADGARLAAELLRDPDDAAGAATIDALVTAVHRIGVTRMDRLFSQARFTVMARHRRVRELTDRQRHLVADLLEELADTADEVAARRTA